MSMSAVEQRAGSPEPPEPVVDEPARLRPRGRRLDPWLIAVLAAAISAGWAGRPSLWFDEGATISASANRTLPELWKLLGHIDAVHGLYYLLMHGWFAIFPPTEFWSRFPSCLAIGGAAAGVVVFTRQFAGAGHGGVCRRRLRHSAAGDVGRDRSPLLCAVGGRRRLADRIARRRGAAQPAAAVAALRAGVDAVDLGQHQPGAVGTGVRRDAAACWRPRAPARARRFGGRSPPASRSRP